MKQDTSDNDNLNDNLYIDNVDDNAGIDKVLISSSSSSSLDDEEDLSSGPSGDTYAQNDDLMNILSKGKKEFKDTYEDPIRMYLKEIGDVKLLSRKDEEVLARTIDLKLKYKNMHDELEETSAELINSTDLIKQIFQSIVSLKPILESIGKFYGVTKANSVSLSYLASKESEISKILFSEHHLLRRHLRLFQAWQARLDMYLLPCLKNQETHLKIARRNLKLLYHLKNS